MGAAANTIAQMTGIAQKAKFVVYRHIPARFEVKNLKKNKQDAGTDTAAVTQAGVDTGLELDLVEGTDRDTFATYKVRFNPETLRFSATGGETSVGKYSIDGSGGSMVSKTLDPMIEMSVKLIFDTSSTLTSFLDFSGMTEVNSIVNNIGSLAKGITAAVKVSAQVQAESFISALRNPDTKGVALVWGDMSYRGTLTGVNVTYTMFSLRGTPDRAEVSLSILLNGDNNKWKKASEKGFPSSILATLQKANQMANTAAAIAMLGVNSFDDGVEDDDVYDEDELSTDANGREVNDDFNIEPGA